MKSLFEVYDLRGQKLRNRVVMAPMTRPGRRTVSPTSRPPSIIASAPAPV